MRSEKDGPEYTLPRKFVGWFRVECFNENSVCWETVSREYTAEEALGERDKLRAAGKNAVAYPPVSIGSFLGRDEQLESLQPPPSGGG